MGRGPGLLVSHTIMAGIPLPITCQFLQRRGQRLAQESVACELFSAQFPANRDDYRECYDCLSNPRI
jgi:hypothetical protein